MRIGAIFPTTEIGADPVVVRDWAQAAEQLGYSDVLCYDHVLRSEHAGREPALAGPYTENDPFHLALRAMDTAAEFVGARRVGFKDPQACIDALETFKRETGFQCADAIDFIWRPASLAVFHGMVGPRPRLGEATLLTGIDGLLHLDGDFAAWRENGPPVE